MKLSELIAAVGDDNVMFQNLDSDIIRLRFANGKNEITFGTHAMTTLNGTEKLGLVVWLDRDAVEKVTPSKDLEGSDD